MIDVKYKREMFIS